jgi:ABC-type multidrug transport system ATPase subunit
VGEAVVVAGDARRLQDDPVAGEQLLRSLGLGRVFERKGFGTEVAPLSGGEEQRLALAVGLFARPGVLVVDEPTAKLDAATVPLVMSALDQEVARNGTTLIVVTHDLDLVRDFDAIAMVEDGRVVEKGTHQKLMGAGGPYERLYTEFVDPDRRRILAVQNRMLEAGAVQPDSLDVVLAPFLERPGHREPAWARLGLRLLNEDIERDEAGPVRRALAEVVEDMRRHGLREAPRKLELTDEMVTGEDPRTWPQPADSPEAGQRDRGRDVADEEHGL